MEALDNAAIVSSSEFEPVLELLVEADMDLGFPVWLELLVEADMDLGFPV